MQIYPAYTIDQIEEELSGRQVEELMKCWSDKGSVFQSIRRLENMVEKKFGFKKVSSMNTLSGEALENKLREDGWL